MTPSDTPHAPVPDRDDADEVDPTGIRDLLRALPDPGPMPEDLVRRIETRLAVELAHRTPSHPFTEEPVDGRGARVVDLERERERRRPRRTVLLLGTAAAGLLVATVTVGDLLGSGVVGGADTAAYAPASEGAGRDGAAGGAEEQGEAGDGQVGTAQDDAGQDSAGQDDAGMDTAAGGAGDGVGPAPAGGQDPSGVRVLADLGEVDDARLAEIVEEARRSAEGADADEQPPTLSAAQAISCWQAVAADPGWQGRHAAAATMDADPVVVLWASDGAGREHAWLMPGACVVNPAVTPLADLALAP